MSAPAPRRRLAMLSLLVPDYDEAIAYYVGVLGFRLIEDMPQGEGKRWVVLAPGDGTDGARLLLARASDAAQRAQIGAQAGGRVLLFLHTDDFARDYQAWRDRGVEFRAPPRQEAYGTVAVFRDRYGNLWDLIEPLAATL